MKPRLRVPREPASKKLLTRGAARGKAALRAASVPLRVYSPKEKICTSLRSISSLEKKA